MPSLLDIRRRIRAVKSTQQITKAMKMVAASRLRRAQERIQQARPYASEMLRVLNSLASRVDPSAHPLLDEREVLDTVFAYMRAEPRNRLMADFWREARTLRVVRRPPHVTSAGKILPLHLARPPYPPPTARR